MIASAVAVPSFARAEQVPAPAETAPPPPLDHQNQTGLSLMPGIGYRVIVPYQDDIDCGDSSGHATKRVCTNGLPLFLDLQLSYGATRRIDVLADLRFGIVQGFTHSRQFALAPGIRYWLDPELAVKAFTVVELVYDSTRQNNPKVSDTDFGARVALGVMYDVVRNFGVFFQTGATMGVTRWFRIELDAGLGAQVRFP